MKSFEQLAQAAYEAYCKKAMELDEEGLAVHAASWADLDAGTQACWIAAVKFNAQAQFDLVTRLHDAAFKFNPHQQFDLVTHLHRQIAFSERTFGPGERTVGVVDHITKELVEVVESGGDLEEWIDVIILALDGAWRSGHTPEQIVEAIVAKQIKNECRIWPDWRTAEPGKAIEHVRTEGVNT